MRLSFLFLLLLNVPSADTTDLRVEISKKTRSDCSGDALITATANNGEPVQIPLAKVEPPNAEQRVTLPNSPLSWQLTVNSAVCWSEAAEWLRTDPAESPAVVPPDAQEASARDQ